MLQLGRYSFDRVGVLKRSAGGRLHEWSALERFDVAAGPANRGIRYAVVLSFADAREVSLLMRPDWLGRPRVKELAAVLKLARQGAPTGAEFSSRAQQVLEWGGLDEFAANEMKSIDASSADVSRLLRAANWRWARLEYGRATTLAKRAARRSAADPEPHRLLLALALEQRQRPRQIAALAREVLSRDAADPTAQAARLIAELKLRGLALESTAREWLREHPDDRQLTVALAHLYQRVQRFTEAAEVVRALQSTVRASARRAELERAIQHLERMAGDTDYRQRTLNRQRWTVALSLAGACVLFAVIAVLPLWRAWNKYDHQRRAAVRRLDPRAPHTMVLEKAQRGDVQAMMQVATQFELGLFVKKDPAAAQAWRLRAAQAGDAAAMVAVARRLLDGKNGITKDATQAEQWLQKAAATGDRDAYSTLGDLYYYGKDLPQDYARAFELYQRAADEKHSHALGQVAFMQERGRGTAKDLAAALRSYVTLVERNNNWPQSRIAYLIGQNAGSQEDRAAGLAVLRRRAEGGNADAQANLGLMLYFGRGAPRNEPEGVRWMERAAEKKNIIALMNLAAAYRYGNGVPKDLARGAEYARQAAATSDKSAEYYYAQLQRTGTGVEKDPVAARLTLERLLDAGFLPAQVAIAELYLNGEGVDEDRAKARALLAPRKGADNLDATTRLAVMQWHGIGGPIDRKAALENLRHAHERKYSTASLLLAGAIAAGDKTADLEPDRAEALRMLESVAGSGEMNAGLVTRYLKAMKEGADLPTILEGGAGLTPPPPVPAAPRPEDLPVEAPPTPVSQARPIYPFAMRYLRIGGEVLVDFIIDPQGGTCEVKALRSSEPGFERAAVTAVARWHFIPATKDGRAVPMHMQVPIVFTLNEDSPTNVKVEARRPR